MRDYGLVAQQVVGSEGEVRHLKDVADGHHPPDDGHENHGQHNTEDELDPRSKPPVGGIHWYSSPGATRHPVLKCVTKNVSIEYIDINVNTCHTTLDEKISSYYAIPRDVYWRI